MAEAANSTKALPDSFCQPLSWGTSPLARTRGDLRARRINKPFASEHVRSAQGWMEAQEMQELAYMS